MSLRSLLYVREVDVPRLDAKRGWEFATKHQLAARLVSWFVARLRSWRWERLVLVRFDDGGWVPYFCTDPNAVVRDILEAAADRWAIEEHFHDVKEI